MLGHILPGEVCISKRWSSSIPTVKFSGGNAYLRYERPKKLILSGSKQRSYFSPFVDKSSPNLVGIYGSDRSLQRRLLMDDILFPAGDIRDQIAKSEIMMFLGRQFFWGRDPKFLAQF